MNFRLWELVKCANLSWVQRGNMVAEAEDILTKYFDSSDSGVG